MNSLTKAISIATVALGLSSSGFAQPKVTASAEVWNKDIIGRGFVLSTDPYLKTEVNISSADSQTYLYANQKYNLATGGTDRGTYVGAGKTFSLPAATITAEVGQLMLPNGWKIPEIYTAATLKAPLNPTIEAVVSGGNFAGNYFSGALSHTFKVADNTSIALKAKVGYNDAYGTNFSAFSHANLDVSISQKMGKSTTATIGARVQKSLHEAVANDTAVYAKIAYRF